MIYLKHFTELCYNEFPIIITLTYIIVLHYIILYISYLGLQQTGKGIPQDARAAWPWGEVMYGLKPALFMKPQ